MSRQLRVEGGSSAAGEREVPMTSEVSPPSRDLTSLHKLGFDLGEASPERLWNFSETNYHRVRDAIRLDIVRGILPQGQRLKVVELATHYGLSPAPIREALNQLEGEGLVVIRPNRGAIVRPLEPAFIRELFEIRLALEPFLVGKCAALVTDEHLEAIEAIQCHFEEAIERRDLAAIIQRNGVFHASIYRIRPNIEALRLMSRHSALMGTIRHRYGFAPARLPTIVEEHHELIEALRRRDSAGAEAVERRHIEHSIEDIIARYAEVEGGGGEAWTHASPISG